MGNLFGLLHLGNSGLVAGQAGIQTSGHNLTNVNTKGYHRQDAVQAAERAIRSSGRPLGSGVQSLGARRVLDFALEQRRRGAQGEAGSAEARASVLGRAETIFGDLAGGGLSSSLDALFASFNDLANRPADASTRAHVLASADRFVAEVNRQGQELSLLRGELNASIEAGVAEVNALAAQVAEANRTLRLEGSEVSNDLLDQRAAALDRLVQWTGARVVERDDGVVDVSLPGGTALVSFEIVNPLSVRPDAQGLMRVVGREAAGEVDLTPRLSQGKLGGYLVARDTDLAAVEGELDAFVFAAAGAINTVHRTGFGLDGVGGRDLFAAGAGVAGAARSLAVSADVAGAPERLGAAADPARVPGDNQVALALAALATSGSVNGQAPADGLRDVLTGFAERAHQAVLRAEATEAVESKLVELEQSVSGVSIDEEMVNLLRFRQAYAAAAQVVRTADELVSEVLSLKR